MFSIQFTKQAQKDAELIKQANLISNVLELLIILITNPFQSPPEYEKLTGDLNGLYSRRINRHHRIWYSVDKKQKTVYIERMWTHYE